MELKALLGDWHSLCPALLYIYQAAVPESGQVFRKAVVDNHCAWLLEEGEATVVQASTTITAHAGEWLVAYPGERQQRFSPDARIISVHFQAKWPDGRQLFKEGISSVFASKAFPEVERQARLFLSKMAGCFPENPQHIRYTHLSLEKYFLMQHCGFGFLAALAEALQAEGVHPSRVRKTDERLLETLRFLNAAPLSEALDLAGFANHLGLTDKHLSRLLSEEFNVTPHRYFANRRIDYARRVLSHSTLPIKEIASHLGFRTLADFSTWFKRIETLSPREYRNRTANVTIEKGPSPSK